MMLKALLALIPAVLALDHAITIGLNNTLTFTPDQVVAAIGDTLTFTVVARNHSTTTTNYDGAVCPPPPGGVGENGWDSGFLSDLDGSMPQFVYTVVDTAPHFAACMQANGAHCSAGGHDLRVEPHDGVDLRPVQGQCHGVLRDSL
ncbi:hypothetical protein B0H10DRAFT_877843 [Mycena sp. CBHHK59/15]|nr:hypothetical protein B0H10DRAFT_877843 [Mycena sp. CBHHK59/15]